MKVNEPKFYHEALKDVKWREAMNKEIEALDKTCMWEVVDLPPGKNRIGWKALSLSLSLSNIIDGD